MKCKKCGKEMEVDISSLNKKDYYCLSCLNEKKVTYGISANFFIHNEEKPIDDYLAAPFQIYTSDLDVLIDGIKNHIRVSIDYAKKKGFFKK